MKRKPLIFSVLALAYFVTALAIPAQIGVLYEHSVSEYAAILQKISIMNWFVIVACVASVPLLQQGSPHLKLAIPISFGIVAYNNFIVGAYAIDYSVHSAFLGTLAFAALHAPLLQPSVFRVLLKPELRWWKSAQRKVMKVPIAVNGKKLGLRAHTFDLSMTGIYVTAKGPEAENLMALGRRETVTLSLELPRHAIFCTGKVIRYGSGNGRYPAGIGIQFTEISGLNRALLQGYLQVA